MLTDEKLSDIYESDYKDNYYQDAKDEFAEYKVSKVHVARRYGESVYNKQILTNKEELEQIAFDDFKEDFKNGKIHLKE